MIFRNALVLWLLATCSPLHAADATVFARTDILAYSDTLPVYALFHDLDAKYEAGNVAFTHDQVEVGVSYGQWSLSALYRYDYYLDFSKDSFELVYRQKHDQPVEAGRQYNLRVDANHMMASGLKLAWQFQPTQALGAKVAIAYLKATDLLNGNVRGRVAVDARGNYQGAADIDYAYDEDVLFDRKARSSDGEGYAIDLAVTWVAAKHLRLTADLADLVSRIEWDNAPYTRAHVTSATSSFDSNGSLHTVPTLNGVEGYRTEVQRLPVRTTVTADFALTDRHHISAAVFQVESTTLPRLGVQHFGNWGDFGLHYDVVARAVGFSYRYGAFEFAYTSDALDYKGAHMLGMRLGFNVWL